MSFSRFIITRHPIGPDTGTLAERQAARRARRTLLVGTPADAATRFLDLTGASLSVGTVATQLRRGRTVRLATHKIEPVT